jgi:hypothetical protein
MLQRAPLYCSACAGGAYAGAGHVCACSAEVYLYCRAHNRCSCTQAVPTAYLSYILLCLRPQQRLTDNCVFDGPARAQHSKFGPSNLKECTASASCLLCSKAGPGNEGGCCSGNDRQLWRSGRSADICYSIISLSMIYSDVPESSGAETHGKQRITPVGQCAVPVNITAVKLLSRTLINMFWLSVEH